MLYNNKGIKIGKVCCILCCVLCFSSCKERAKSDATRELYAQIEDQYLYYDELESLVPEGASSADSVSLVNDYVKKWAINTLLFVHAKENISNQKEIDRMTEDYRKSLIIHQYVQNMLNERMGKSISREELTSFYEKNQDLFILSDDVIQGISIKVAKGAKDLKKLRKWMNQYNEESIEKIEKYCIENASNYEYFVDKWVKLSTISTRFPCELDASWMTKGHTIELSDSAFVYMLYVNDFRAKGKVEPIDMAQEQIKTILLNQKKNEFLKSFEENLYKKALKDGDIIMN